MGVTSFGSIFGCDRGFPAAYTKVAAYLDWISDETGIESHQEVSNAMLLDKYLRDYNNKMRKRKEEYYTDATADPFDVEPIYHDMQRFGEMKFISDHASAFYEMM